MGTYSAGDPHVGVVIDDITQIFPSPLKWESGALHVVGEPDAQGQFSAVTPGMTLTAQSLAKPVRVVWLDGQGVVAVSEWKACSGTCTKQTAPAGSTFVVVQAKDAGRFEVADGSAIQVQLTKVNVPANMRTNLATSTQVPGR